MENGVGIGMHEMTLKPQQLNTLCGIQRNSQDTDRQRQMPEALKKLISMLPERLGALQYLRACVCSY